MSMGGPVERKLPSDVEQTFTVAKYELLKHFRSWRLFGTIAIVIVIVGLLYALPPAFGQPYTGHMDQELDPRPLPASINMLFPPGSTYANLTRGGIQLDSLSVTLNGTAMSNLTWAYEGNLRAVILFGNYSAYDVVAHYDFKRGTDSFTEFFLNFASLLVVICAIFFGADSIVSEYQNRTAYLLFPNPVRRSVMFSGKMIASIVASSLMIGLFYVAISLLSLLTLGEVAKYLYLSFAFAIMYLLGCLGLSYFISSFMKGSTGSIVLTFFMLMIILPIFSGVGSITGVKFWFLLTFAGETVTNSLSADNYPTDSQTTFGGPLDFTIYNYYPDMAVSAIVLLVYFIALSILSMILFKKKQLTG